MNLKRPVQATVTIKPKVALLTTTFVCKRCKEQIELKRVGITVYRLICNNCGFEEEKDLLEV